MPRTNKTVSQLVKDDSFDVTTAGNTTTIDATLVTNGLAVTGAFGKKGSLVLHVKNTAVAAKTVTVRKGAGQAAAGNAEIVKSVAATTGDRLIVLAEPARYQQANGDVNVDFETGMTGSIAVYRVPR